MKIQILSVEVNQTKSKAGKPYEQLVVAYKNLDFGKVEQKIIMPFGFQKDAFVTIKAANATEVYDVEVQKNEAGYNDWIKATKGTASAATSVGDQHTKVSASTTAGTKGNWETPDERAKKQVYIIRQSSLGHAVATLSVGAKTAPTSEKVIELAKAYEDFVLGNTTDDGFATAVSKDIMDLEEDLPF